jgi:hypothetical protein
MRGLYKARGLAPTGRHPVTASGQLSTGTFRFLPRRYLNYKHFWLDCDCLGRGEQSA